MGKRTILTAENFTLGTGNVLAAISTAAAGSAAANVSISRVEITQNHNTTTLAGIRGAFSTRTGGTLTMTATAPVAVQPLGAAASGLAGSTAPAGAAGRSGTNSSVDTTPTYVDHHYFNFMNYNGYLFKPDNEGEEILIPPSTIWCVRLLATPGDTAGWTISIFLEEM